MKTAEPALRPSPPDVRNPASCVTLGRDQSTARRRRGRRVKGRGWLVRRALLLGDLLGLASAFLAAELALGRPGVSADGVTLEGEFLLFALTLPVWVVLAKVYGLYDRDEERTDHSTPDDLAGVLHLVTVGTWLLFAGARLGGLATPDLGRLALFWTLAIVLVTLARASARALCRRHQAYVQRTVIVGTGEVGELIARKFLRHPEYGVSVLGFVDRGPGESEASTNGLPILGPPEEIPRIVQTLGVDRVVVAFSSASDDEVLDLLRALNELGVQVDVVPRLFEAISPGVGIHTVEGLPLIGLPPPRLSWSSHLLKRTMDVALSALGLTLLTPAFMAIAIVIKLSSSGPVFFRQERVGAGDQIFGIYKFRTMAADADEHKAEVADLNMHARDGSERRMFKIPEDPRVTRVGRFLRRHSLDELPQLLNVLKGEMALVGPRPLILEEDRHVRRWERRRLDLKPGMSGLWQVLGRSQIPFDEMVRLDYLYVTTWSVWNDIRLLLRTIPLVLRGQGGSY